MDQFFSSDSYAIGSRHNHADEKTTVPCSGVEFPVAVKGLFRPHYVIWSEQEWIEAHGPEYLKNIVRIITETGLQVYKELTPMKKDQVTGGPLQPGFGLSGDVHTSQTWSDKQTIWS